MLSTFSRGQIDPQSPPLLLKPGVGLFEIINLPSVPKVSFITRSISTGTYIPTICIMRLIPCFQPVNRNSHQSMGDLASLKCQLLMADGILSEVRQDPYPNDVVDEAEQKSLPRSQSVLTLMLVREYENLHSNGGNNIRRIPEGHIATSCASWRRHPRHDDQKELNENREDDRHMPCPEAPFFG